MTARDGIIDRFEGDVVVVEINGEAHDFAKSQFPTEAKVGDFVRMTGNQVIILHDQTKARKKEVADLMSELWED